jgi:hypothetical protein
MKKKYDWNFIQSEYNNGMSHSQLRNEYGVSSRAIFLAKARGEFISRNKNLIFHILEVYFFYGIFQELLKLSNHFIMLYFKNLN